MKKEAKASKIARESKRKAAGSFDCTWMDCKAISMAEAQQTAITISAHSMWCTITKPATWAASSSTTWDGASVSIVGESCVGYG